MALVINSTMQIRFFCSIPFYSLCTKITIICVESDFIKLNQAKFSTLVLLRIVAKIVRAMKID